MELAFFCIVGGVAVLAALGVILARNAVYSALFLVLVFLSLAALYTLLNAPFIAAVQVVVYAGAVMVLFLFVIMMLGLERGEGGTPLRAQKPLAILLGVVFLLQAGYVVSTSLIRGQRAEFTPQKVALLGGNTQALGRLLLSDNLLAFEMISVLLLVAMVGVVVLAQREKD